jgi:hypothetical protein
MIVDVPDSIRIGYFTNTNSQKYYHLCELGGGGETQNVHSRILKRRELMKESQEN